jgi:NlpC/P60 family putative phage cell wall peptidase
MATQQQVIDTARSWIGTPYHHQARLQGVGADCIGLILGVCWELGLTTFDTSDYAETPEGDRMIALIEHHCTKLDAMELGALLVLRIRRLPQHTALATDGGMIHAYQGIGKVAEHYLDPWWMSRVVGIYRLPGVEA